MPSAKTEITEIATGLAITGAPTLAEALAARAVANVDDVVWERLVALERAGQHRQEFLAAWANGQAFLQADDGLRGRPPGLVEWKGHTQAPGDEVGRAERAGIGGRIGAQRVFGRGKRCVWIIGWHRYVGAGDWI